MVTIRYMARQVFGLMAISLVAIALSSAQSSAQSPTQSWPQRPVKLLLTLGPGSGADISARLIGEKLAAIWNQPVVVENKPGASTVIGAEAAARAPADGSVIFMGNNSTFSINPNLYRNLPYDPVRDYLPVSLLATIPFVALVHPSVPAHTIQELVALVKASPGKINFGSGSASWHYVRAGTVTVRECARGFVFSLAGAAACSCSYSVRGGNGAGAVLSVISDIASSHKGQTKRVYFIKITNNQYVTR